ncbi:twin-arginine translocation signal domain-containing protein [Streptomyces sp. NPDC047071]
MALSRRTFLAAAGATASAALVGPGLPALSPGAK